MVNLSSSCWLARVSVVRLKVNAIHFQTVDVVEARAFQQTIDVAGVNAETVETACFGVCVKRNLVSLVQSKLGDQHGD